jgi:hypothetical protein
LGVSDATNKGCIILLRNIEENSKILENEEDASKGFEISFKKSEEPEPKRSSNKMTPQDLKNPEGSRKKINSHLTGAAQVVRCFSKKKSSVNFKKQASSDFEFTD